MATPPGDPLGLLASWIEEARAAGIADPRAVAFVTVSGDGRPTARTVSLKRFEASALLFTSTLWTRKARELSENPHVALLFHWPAIGRQVHIAGRASIADRALAEELFAERDLAHRVQTLVSRQGEEIESVEPLRPRHAHLMQALEAPPRCPEDWGAIRVTPEAIELWLQAPDRMHERRLYQRTADRWRQTLLAP